MDKTLKEIWATTLDLEVEEIGDDDNLFELGGDSIKAILIIGEAASHGIYFDIETFNANPTIAGLSAILSAQTSQPVDKGPEPAKDLSSNIPVSSLEAVGISPDNVNKITRPEPNQEYYFELCREGGPESSVAFVYEVEGINLLKKLQQAVNLVSEKNPALRSAFVNVEGAYHQVLLKTGQTEILRHEGDIAEYFNRLVTRIILPGDSIVRFTLVENEEKRFFVFSFLHAFFDAFSCAILERDLLDAVKNPAEFSQKEERSWFGDFVAHKLDTMDLSATKGFWEKYLGDSCLETLLPAKPKDRHTFDSVLHEVVPNSLNQGRPVAPAVFVSWALTLMQESGKKDVAFSIVALGRLFPYPGIERMIGLFVCDRVFRLQVPDSAADISFLLQSVQEDLLSTGIQEHGKVAGILPSFDDSPVAQSLVNVKAGASTLVNQEIDGLTIIPRRDIEHWSLATRYAIYIEMELRDDDYLFEMRYQSTLIPSARAERLFANFVKTLKLVLGSESGTALENFIKFKKGVLTFEFQTHERKI